MGLTSQQQKALDIAKAVIQTAFSISKGLSEPVPHAKLLRKKPFPDRKIPNRIRRVWKNQARQGIANNVFSATVSALMGAAEVYRIQSTPIPKFPQGTNQIT